MFKEILSRIIIVLL